jgi:uncharacterized protein (TIGR02680 family)
MTPHRIASRAAVEAHPHRFRLSRAGVLNVWQYDDQVFEFAGGRLLLRGANGAGKSKTLEMLLPFVLDGDKLRMTASGRHHTSLLWLMTDGYEGAGRIGYLWVEFVRSTDAGEPEWFTCGVGIRASQSARTASTWYFTSPRRVDHNLSLQDSLGPLSRERCRAIVEEDGHFFESPRQYKQHVGETLFGLAGGRYDELLRLLYWLRQPQVGEDIEPGRLAEILSVALPELDDTVVRAAGGTLDELAAFGEQLARRRQAAEAMTAFAQVYAGYARGVAASRGSALAEAHREQSRLAREIAKRAAELDEVARQITDNETAQQAARDAVEQARQRERDLEASPEARSHRQVLALGKRAEELAGHASTSERQAASVRQQAEKAKRRAHDDAGHLGHEISRLAEAGQSLANEMAALGLHVALTVPAVLAGSALPAEADGLRAALTGLDVALAGHADTAGAARPLVGQRQAAVQVVDEARRAAQQAEAERGAAEREAARLESIAETERARLALAKQAAQAAEERFVAALAVWRADERGVEVQVPGELGPETVQRIGALAREAARPHLDDLVATEARMGSRRERAEEQLAALHEQRQAIEAEADPAPDPPALGRDDRDSADGAPLWRLIEFADHLDAGQRAGLEAALESSGLLDAWVRVDGQLLGAKRRDVVLPSGPAAPGRTLAALLAVVQPDGCPVEAETVRSVLARISAEPSAQAEAVAGLDGCWRLGPLTGRAAKPVAQYIGVTARATERARRLAGIDARITATDEAGRLAAGAEAEARVRRASVEAWLDAAPAYGPLLTAWADARSRADVAATAEEDARAAEEAARHARTAAVTARRELEELASVHDLPTTVEGLAARSERLRELQAALSAQTDSAARLRERLSRLREDLTAWTDLDCQAAEMEQGASELQAQAAAAAQRHEELRRAVEASVRELEERLRETRAEIAAGQAREKALRAEHTRLAERHGSLGETIRQSSERRTVQETVVIEAAHSVAELADVPGLLASASAPADGSYELARGVTPGINVPAAVVALAHRLAELGQGERPVTEAAVWTRYTEVTSGPAADCEPRVLEHPGGLAVVARDETGERPLGDLASRLQAEVARDAELLTERERRVFEEHILGDLGDALRARRLEAEELVAAMNRLLEGVTTSQGVRVSLHWRLRDDVPGDSRQAVGLLGRPLGALLPDERQMLRDCLHRLIETSRSEQPELSYAEHLGRALDYRQWFAFRVRYTRPELDGRWLDLHRRSPLSQGEQKVVCYLPLFAAAAAHFSSVAGAAPHAPRFVLLDDAFPKIDVRTHPLLFGLLVDLDLDFLITSERLWGDHETVPSLAIYEALRDPSERGIAQYEHRWDGQRLHAVGA